MLQLWNHDQKLSASAVVQSGALLTNTWHCPKALAKGIDNGDISSSGTLHLALHNVISNMRINEFETGVRY